MMHLHDENDEPLCGGSSLPLEVDGVCAACDSIWWRQLKALWAAKAKAEGLPVGKVLAWVMGQRPFVQDVDQLVDADDFALKYARAWLDENDPDVDGESQPFTINGERVIVAISRADDAGQPVVELF